MGSWPARLHAFTLRHRTAVFAMALLWVIAACWIATGLRVEEDLFQALPKDPAITRYQELLRADGTARRVAVGFTADSARLDSAFAAADRFVRGMESTGLGVKSTNGPDLGAIEDLISAWLGALPVLVDSTAVHRFATGDGAAIDSTVARAFNGLLAPSGAVTEPLLLGDPAGLLASRLKLLRGMADMAGLQVEQGRYVARDGRTAFVMLELPALAGDKRAEAGLVAAVEAAMRAAAGSEVRPCWFGALPIERKNAERIAADARFTSLIALALVIAVLLFYFRSVHAPILLVLPALFGAVSALAGMTLLQGRVSAIALGGAAALLGIAVAYGTHLLVHRRASGSVRSALEATSPPLLLGCATTVIAFLGLRLLDSQLLRDLGTLSAMMLGATALFTIVVLPLLMRDTAPAAPAMASPRAARTARWAKWAILPVIAITILLSPWVNEAHFDDEPGNLGWMPEEMKRASDLLFGADPGMRSVFIVATARDTAAAFNALERTGAALHSEGLAVVLPTDVRPSAAAAAHAWMEWKRNFGEGRGALLAANMMAAAERQGFTADAFDGFTRWLIDVDSMAPPAVPEVAFQLPGTNLLRKTDGTVLVSGLLRCGAATLPTVERIIAQANEASDSAIVQALSREVLGQGMARIAKTDLGTTLLFTTLLVFVALLLTYGRIEITLITFLPMALSWWWILGVCGLLHIPFNMVNVLACTFIFGLGDDFCVFTTDGILQRYRSGRDHTRADRHAIVLSGATTLIGTGALLLAQHPALRSIASLSVVGMVCILLVTLTVQPWLFRILITDRAARGRYPFTARSLLVSLFAFGYFLIGCVLLMAAFPILTIAPFKRELQRRGYGWLVMWFTRSLVHIMLNVRKDIRSFAAEVEQRQSLVIANHSSFIDILLMLMVHPRMLIMVNRWVWRSPFFGAVVRFMGYPRIEDDLSITTARMREALREGWSITIFPEGTRSTTDEPGRFHKGAFHLAEELRAPLVPVLLHGVGHAMSKGDWLLKDARMSMRTLPTIEAGDARYGSTVRERSKAITAVFKQAMAAHRAATETPDHWREKLVRNFTYKGPVLEWYVRVKSRIDAGLHERIHASIAPDATVVDLGCGHGMLSYLLHWSSPARTLLGVDHDAEKIAVATNSFTRGAALRFAQADLSTFDPPEADAFILKDVLHYLNPDQQAALLLRCARRLRANGAVIVRDGFGDRSGPHALTRLTEFFSTRVFGFNKVKDRLYFTDRAGMETMAAAAGLRCDWSGDARTTSNQLVILRR